ncbi:hypothetical protein SKAU_G00295310 [Synaphobranchus kaupii]|uniref:GOLD domain-containing protein n=1 Tax=Synaphobranchus kaupii TaxID=118154 RepID=A0A9Q1EUP3_SYNKA|nr:hypothetical protein SKAU_G00295310 [Synaphobranchus kaupii]
MTVRRPPTYFGNVFYSGNVLGMGMYFIVCLAYFVDSIWAFGQNRDTEFTFLLPAGRTECFYQTTTVNGTMEVEYQVIAGAGMDVDFTIFSPHGVQLSSDFRRSDGIHTVESTEKGDYKICFDNSFSRVSEKMVFFEVILEEQERRRRRRLGWHGGAREHAGIQAGGHQGVGGVGSQALGAQPADADCSSRVRGSRPQPAGGQPVAGVLLVLHEPASDAGRGRDAGVHRAQPLQRQEEGPHIAPPPWYDRAWLGE